MVQSPLLSLSTSTETALTLAERVRELRLNQGWTRKTLAERSGVSLGSLERFERTGLVSLESLLKIANALGRLGEFEQLFHAPRARSLDELEQRQQKTARKRGRI